MRASTAPPWSCASSASSASATDIGRIFAWAQPEPSHRPGHAALQAAESRGTPAAGRSTRSGPQSAAEAPSGSSAGPRLGHGSLELRLPTLLPPILYRAAAEMTPRVLAVRPRRSPTTSPRCCRATACKDGKRKRGGKTGIAGHAPRQQARARAATASAKGADCPASPSETASRQQLARGRLKRATPATHKRR